MRVAASRAGTSVTVRRRSQAEVADLRPRVLAMRLQQGLSFAEIASRVGLNSPQSASYHYNEALKEVGKRVSDLAPVLHLVQELARLEADRSFALRQRDSAAAEHVRLAWHQEARKAADQIVRLKTKARLIRPAPAGFDEARIACMSDTELETEIERLRRELIETAPLGDLLSQAVRDAEIKPQALP